MLNGISHRLQPSRGTVDFIWAQLYAVVNTGLGEMQKDIVYTSVRDAYRARGFDDISSDDLIDILEYPTLKDVLKRIEHYEQIRHVGNVAARCRPLLEMDLFRPNNQQILYLLCEVD
jgi:DNA phosphorothioation-dependent restriction protein DptH